MPAESELRQQLSTLPAEDRAELALFLIESLDSEVDADADTLWEAELDRRAEQIKSGTVQGEAARSVMDRLWKKHS
jgi:putative addiction module component (TIGR02574 family)